MATVDKDFKIKNGLVVTNGGTFGGAVTVATPTLPTHATTKEYVDSLISGGSVTFDDRTSSQWSTDNPQLDLGTIAWESDTNKFKIGDGVNLWADLPYFIDEDTIGTSLGNYVETSLLAQPDGVATLNSLGKIESSQIPSSVSIDNISVNTVTGYQKTNTVGKYVALSYDTSTTQNANIPVATSTDGTTWNTQNIVWTSSTKPGAYQWQSITYGDGKLVATTPRGSSFATAIVSTDGTNWASSFIGYSDNPTFLSVSYTSGNFFFFATNTNKVYWRASAGMENSFSWSTGTLPATANWSASTVGNSSRVVAISSGSNNATYGDGATPGSWTLTTLPSSVSWTSVAFSNQNGYYSAIASNTTDAAYSTDGITWQLTTMPSSSEWKSITYAENKFVAIASNGTSAAYSTDGITWNASTLPSSSDWRSIVYALGKFNAIAYNTTSSATSTDGITWTIATMPSGNWSVAYAYDTNVIVGSSITMDSFVKSGGTSSQFLKADGSVDSNSYITASSTNTLTNKTLTDSTTFFQDQTDNTKKMQFELSGITSGQTRTLTIPNVNGTIITTGDTGTVTSTMIADGTIVNADINASAAIAVSKLSASSVTINGTSVTLGNSATITAANPNALTIGTGLSGTSYSGASAVTIAIDSTVATLTGTQTLSNKTLGSDLSAGTYKITNLGTPSASSDAATKQYVDDFVQGLHVHASVVAASTANVPSTYNNGTSGVGATLTNNATLAAFTLDGVSPALNDRVLIKNQSNTFQNGIYTLTTVGSASVAWVLTRATDFDTPTEIDGGDFVFVTGGTVNDNTGWVQTETVSTVGTSPMLFTQFSGAGTYQAGNGLSITGNTFSINTSVTADLTTAQTLTNKTLTAPRITSASHIADSNGNELIVFPATVASAVNEITVSNATTGNTPSITASGGDANISLNLVSKGTGTVQIGGVPAVTTTGTQILTNKTLTDSTTFLQDETDTTKKMQFQLSGITTANTRTLTVPDASGTIALTSNNLGVFGSTTSAQLASVISDETGTGSLVFSTSPTFAGTAVIPTANVNTLTGYSIDTFSGYKVLASDGSTVKTSTDAVTWTTLTTISGHSMLTSANKYFFATSTSTATYQYSTNGTTWTTGTFPSQFIVDGKVAYGNNRYVAIGHSNSVSVSTNGITWTVGGSVATPYLNDIIFALGRFIAVRYSQSNNEFISSTDGITWSTTVAPSYANWSYLAASPTTVIAVGNGSNPAIASSTNGTSWTSRLVVPGSWLVGAAYGNGKFVSLVQNTATAYHSTDGITWTTSTLPSSQAWNEVIFDSQTSKFIASTSSASTAVSTDGVTWSSISGAGRYAVSGEQYTPVASSINIGSVTATSITSNSIVKSGGTSSQFLKADGSVDSNVYAPTASPTFTGTATASSLSVNSITGYQIPPSTYVAVASGTGTVAYSADSVTWSTSTLPSSSSWSGVAYGNGRFVAVASSTTAAISTNGIVWTTQTLPNSAGRIIYALGKFLATQSGSNNASWSTDGITWNSVTNTAYGQTTISKIFNYFVSEGASYFTSTDGITWASGNASGAANPVFASSSEGASGTAVAISTTSASLSTRYLDYGNSAWTLAPNPGAGQVSDLIYASGKFVALSAGNTNTAVYSTNSGRAWSTATLPATANWKSITYGNGKFTAIATGPSTIAATSTDGITWTSVTLPSSQSWTDSAYGDVGGSVSSLTIDSISAGSLTLTGDLTVNGTTTTINSTTVTVDDKNIELGSVATPTNTTADGGGITLKGATDKTFNWINATGAWTSSEDIDLASGKVYEINGTTVLSSTQVLGKSLPTGDVVGTSDSQTLSNKTINNGILTGTLTAGGSTGTNGQVLQSTATGVQWATVSGYSAPTIGSTLISSGSTVTSISGLTLSGATLDSTLTAGGTTGTNGQVLQSTGTGVQWASVAGGATVAETAPISPSTGQFWYNTSIPALLIYDGSFWVRIT